MSVVLTVQALLFADGGLTALGTNITLMGIVTVAVGWFTAKAVIAILPKRPTSVIPASFMGALLSVPASAAVFVLLYAIGGEVELPFRALMVTMIGWHTLIGIGEALITAATVGAVVAVRPDLVYAARKLMPTLKLKTADGSLIDAEPATAATLADDKRAVPVGKFALGAVGLIVLIAGIASFFASSNPDGLEYVAEDKGFIESARDHFFGDFALADYGDVGGIPVGVAGLIGVALVLAIGWVLFRFVARKPSEEAPKTPQKV
jgi:cobalt/nickel transport system permease protein